LGVGYGGDRLWLDRGAYEGKGVKGGRFRKGGGLRRSRRVTLDERVKMGLRDALLVEGGKGPGYFVKIEKATEGLKEGNALRGKKCQAATTKKDTRVDAEGNGHGGGDKRKHYGRGGGTQPHLLVGEKWPVFRRAHA